MLGVCSGVARRQPGTGRGVDRGRAKFGSYKNPIWSTSFIPLGASPGAAPPALFLFCFGVGGFFFFCARSFFFANQSLPCAMPRALRDVGAAVTCLQLLLLVTGAEPRPRGWDGDRTQLEAVKKGILERLGMSAPPVIRQRLDQDSIRRAQRLYRQKVAEVMRNRSREEEEVEEGAVSRTRRLHRLTPTRKWPWLRVHPVTLVPRVSPAVSPLGHGSACWDMTGHEPHVSLSPLPRRLLLPWW